MAIQLDFPQLPSAAKKMTQVLGKSPYELDAPGSGVRFPIFLLSLFRIGGLLYPGRDLRALKNRVRFASFAVPHFGTLRKWHRAILSNPKLAGALERSPKTHGAIEWPYIHRDWPIARRLDAIRQHYEALNGPACVLDCASRTEIEIARFESEYPGLRLVLDRGWFVREGEIALNLFLDDRRIYSIAFSLGIEGDKLVTFVGALQGSNDVEIWALYRELTKALHRMRPRDLLVVSLQFLCKALRAGAIYAISNDSHHFRSPYFRVSQEARVLLDYDEVWTEHGGFRSDDGFFRIPVAVRYRNANEIATRKRAVYRRRYQMLDRLAAEILVVCERHNSNREKVT